MHLVLEGPLPEIANRFSRFLAAACPHDALVIYTRECTGRPRKVAGPAELVDRVSIDELDAAKESVSPGDVVIGDVVLAGGRRPVLMVRDETDTLLVLVAKRGARATRPTVPTEVIRWWFALVAVSIRQQVSQASPDYLAESRAASSERARTIAQLTEAHEDTLASILSVLRSRDIDDRAARSTAAETASAALISLRGVGDTDRKLATEALTAAFDRLRDELEPVVRQWEIDVEYVGPDGGGRTIPGEIAHAARAIVRTVTVAFGVAQQHSRVRVAWECVDGDLVIDVRDQGNGDLDGSGLRSQLGGRLGALGGRLEVETLAGWGSRVTVRIQLEEAQRRPDEERLSALNPREREVLGHLALGRRNKSIAAELGVSENTIKFHVTSILQKLHVSNRGEAGLLAARAGITAG
ncbi:LuxR C-terminal-related transcriptional regulator [Gordonia bronchialis]|uniref:helix-turn-helix transcriptional regulator n=1 Tax=Gordonia bronchialis TaxID=2054 RepID=UPI001CC016EB|nr:LuxR C-terminal-related transcriptional regulator [Gordonia bronchialis]UAK40677.1 LuxR C-terminal-related transcriptional regulator [Gordonia bronchialis]